VPGYAFDVDEQTEGARDVVVKELITEGFDEEQVVALYVDNGFNEIQARGILAIELGRHDEADDVICVDA
jgi:hypothetical protein